jgi:hypothetical protein
MSNVNFIRGLHRVRVSYPLSFSPSGEEVASTVALLGAGIDNTTREAMGANIRGISLFLSTALTSTVHGFRVDLKTASASGIFRTLESLVDFAGTNVGVSTNVYAVRGYSKVSGTISSGAGAFFAAGLQGKIELAGTIGGEATFCAVMAQINSSAGAAAATGGLLYGLWVSNQLSARFGASSSMICMETSPGSVCIDNFLTFAGKATYVAAFQTNGDCTSSAATTPSGAGGWLKVLVNNVVRYINLYTTP